MKRLLLSLALIAGLFFPIPPIANADVLVVSQDKQTGYNRSLFKHWIDADKDGCNTRAEVLIEEATFKPKLGKKCALTGGKWLSPYDGKTTVKTSDLDIDHVVPLAEAWRSGAWAWSASKRQAFANDLDESKALVAVSLGLNRSKGDKDVSAWLPPKGICTYVENWISVKVKWSLTADSKEMLVLNNYIKSCELIEFESTPTPTPTQSSTTQPRLLTPTISIQDGNWAEIFIPGFAPGVTIATPIRAALSKVNKDDRGTVFLTGRCRLNSKVGPEWGNGSDLPVTPINIYCSIRNDIEFDVFAYTWIGETRIDSEKVSMQVGNPSNFTPTPTPSTTSSQAPTVSPGAFCSPAGASGVSASGVAYTCKTSATDTRNRWRP
jgi:alpha-D-ribose 1-methylphosphonate 5-triphosphate synthase subunit PhnH